MAYGSLSSAFDNDVCKGFQPVCIICVFVHSLLSATSNWRCYQCADIQVDSREAVDGALVLIVCRSTHEDEHY